MKKCIGLLLGFGVLLTAFLAQAEPPPRGGLILKPAAEQSLFLNAAVSISVAVLFLSLAYFGLLLWRKRQTPNLTSHSEYNPVVKTTRRITQKTTLVTVMWQGRAYLLAESQGSLSVLDSVPIEVSPS